MDIPKSVTFTFSGISAYYINSSTFCVVIVYCEFSHRSASIISGGRFISVNCSFLYRALPLSLVSASSTVCLPFSARRCVQPAVSSRSSERGCQLSDREGELQKITRLLIVTGRMEEDRFTSVRKCSALCRNS